MSKSKRLMDALRDDNIFAPCVYDCASTRAAELAGFRAAFVSGSEVSMSMKGIPDLGVLSLDELLWAVDRICNVSEIPIAVDIEDGFGSSPLNVYDTCRRLAKAGASGVLLEDENEPGYARNVVAANMLSRDAFISKVRAAVDALADTDCALIARTNMWQDLDEGIARCVAAHDLGAEMTVIVGLDNIEDATRVAKEVPGVKMFADINSKRGLPEITARDLFDIGFQFVTMHSSMKAAMSGMLEANRQNLADLSNRYSNELMVDEYPGHSGMPFFRPDEWIAIESKYTGVEVAFNDPRRDVSK